MRKDKEKAFDLRKQGKTYRDIEKTLGVSRSTLCTWFSDQDWSTHIKKSNTEKHIKRSIEHLKKLHQGRRMMLEKKYQDTEKEAEKEFEINKKEPLFMAGLMIYAGEGDKRNRNLSRVSNSEFYIHKIFIKFAEKYLNIPKDSIKIGLILYPDHSISECLEKWANELNIPISNFHKTQVIQGREKTRKLQDGIGISIISSTVVVKKKILKWLTLSSTVDF